MIASLFSPNFRRKRLLKQLQEGPIHDFLSVPFPDVGHDCRFLEFVALDLETTGLNAESDEILSVGMVNIQNMHIDLSSAHHYLVKPAVVIPESSAVIHHITDDQAASGEPLESVLLKLLPVLAGKVLIAHHARFELQFLKRAFDRCFSSPFYLPVIDTQAVAQRSLERRNHTYRARDLRLATVRERHHLPRYRLHNALSDALAAAELFLAQLAQYDTSRPIALKNFLLKV